MFCRQGLLLLIKSFQCPCVDVMVFGHWLMLVGWPVGEEYSQHEVVGFDAEQECYADVESGGLDGV